MSARRFIDLSVTVDNETGEGPVVVANGLVTVTVDPVGTLANPVRAADAR